MPPTDQPGVNYRKRIRVLIVDDSAVVRRIIMSTLLRHPDMEVIGTSANGLEAIADIKKIRPDVVTLDIEMPKMDGITALKEIRQFDRSLPIIMFSTLTQRGAESTIEALTCGASDYVGKPSNMADQTEALKVLEDALIPKIRALCNKTASPVKRPAAARIEATAVGSPLPATAPVPPAALAVRNPERVEALCIGVSTGGPAALMQLFSAWTAPLPIPVFIVQHMPPKFTELLSARLTTIGVMQVREAVDGEEAIAGRVYMAPGGRHLDLSQSGTKVMLSLNENPAENSCRPAVDVLFRTAARIYGRRLLAVVLTGMGSDGLKGAEKIVEAGGRVLAQDEETSVIWGMPGAVVNAKLAESVLPLDQIPNEILLRLQRR